MPGHQHWQEFSLSDDVLGPLRHPSLDDLLRDFVAEEGVVTRGGVEDAGPDANHKATELGRARVGRPVNEKTEPGTNDERARNDGGATTRKVNNLRNASKQEGNSKCALCFSGKRPSSDRAAPPKRPTVCALAWTRRSLKDLMASKLKRLDARAPDRTEEISLTLDGLLLIVALICCDALRSRMAPKGSAQQLKQGSGLRSQPNRPIRSETESSRDLARHSTSINVKSS